MAALPEAEHDQDRQMAAEISRWFAEHARALPWRLEPRDPWLSLMSEILLQQTQAARVAERFALFAKRFPTPRAMASRSVDDVLELWSGLGYYRRARLLYACAEAIVSRHDGHVPAEPTELLALPGVGRYTAGAVASIAFGRRAPLVDGNVARVLLRVHGVERAVNEPDVQRWAWQRATSLADNAADVAGYSEGIMELGATVCTPKGPSCECCPIRARCRAFERQLVDRIPQPKTRAPRTPLAITAIVLSDDRQRVLLERRPEGGLWGGLWQPPSVERDSTAPVGLARAAERLGLDLPKAKRNGSRRFVAATTRRTVHVRVWSIAVGDAHAARRARGRSARWFSPDALGGLGLASVHRRMLEMRA